MDMPPLTAPDRPLSPVFWRIMLLLACVLVFNFALHAKLAAYDHGQPQASTSSKLWLTACKAELPPAVPIFPLFWIAAFIACLFHCQAAQRYHAVCETAIPELRRQQFLHRFLRPPPLR
jgi:hypothetical protein